MLKKALLFSLSSSALADVPTNCAYADSLGVWSFDLGTSGGPEVSSTCGYDKLGSIQSTLEIELLEEATAVNKKTGSRGTFTTIYNQGFEIYLDGQKWFVYYYFDSNGYRCDKTSVGYKHDDNGRNWSCIQGTKVNSDATLDRESPFYEMDSWLDQDATKQALDSISENQYFRNDQKFISELNSIENLPWTAEHNIDDEKYTLKEHFLRGGAAVVSDKMSQNFDSKFKSLEDKIEYSKNLKSSSLSDYPENLDWRNMNGQDFVSPVEDQGSCGSCYAFASGAVYESRVRIMSNNNLQPIMSEQNMITCGQDITYNQGCSGGWVVLTGGKYAQDYGLVENSCVPYHPIDRSCQDTSGCQRWYTETYEYLGGYYGATINDDGEAMVKELQNGPIGVGFLVTNEFRAYKNGIFVSTSEELNVTSEFNPLVPVNHAVVVVGYGVCGKNDPECNNQNEGLKYWIVKNSWGKSFGEAGYFKIIRGVNDLGIESMPSRVVPILPV